MNKRIKKKSKRQLHNFEGHLVSKKSAEQALDNKQNDLEERMNRKISLRQWELLKEAADKEDWEKVCNIIQLSPLIMEAAFDMYYELIPDAMKYDFVIDLYAHNGDRYKNIRDALRQLGEYGTPVLPMEFEGQDVITVYRGCQEPITQASDAISWTASKDVAEFFANRNALMYGGKAHVYEGKIRCEDIIAYSNSREEQEIMQSDSVFDIHEVPFVAVRVRTIPKKEP